MSVRLSLNLRRARTKNWGSSLGYSKSLAKWKIHEKNALLEITSIDRSMKSSTTKYHDPCRHVILASHTKFIPAWSSLLITHHCNPRMQKHIPILQGLDHLQCSLLISSQAGSPCTSPEKPSRSDKWAKSFVGGSSFTPHTTKPPQQPHKCRTRHVSKNI